MTTKRKELDPSEMPVREIAPPENVELNRGFIVGLLKPYVKARADATAAEADKTRFGDLIREFLEQQGEEGEELWDGEAQIEAKLSESSMPGRAYDVLSCWQNDISLFERLVLHGCVRFDHKAIEAAGPNVGGAAKYLFPQGKVKRLDVRVKAARS